MKINSLPWPASPYLVRPWLPLQTHLPKPSPPLLALTPHHHHPALPHPPPPRTRTHQPSLTSVSLLWLLLPVLFPRASHNCLLAFSSQVNILSSRRPFVTHPPPMKHRPHSRPVPYHPILSSSWHLLVYEIFLFVYMLILCIIPLGWAPWEQGLCHVHPFIHQHPEQCLTRSRHSIKMRSPTEWLAPRWKRLASCCV